MTARKHCTCPRLSDATTEETDVKKYPEKNGYGYIVKNRYPEDQLEHQAFTDWLRNDWPWMLFTAVISTVVCLIAAWKG